MSKIGSKFVKKTALWRKLVLYEARCSLELKRPDDAIQLLQRIGQNRRENYISACDGLNEDLQAFNDISYQVASFFIFHDWRYLPIAI